MMPANDGTLPSHELVDLRLRNGWIVRKVAPAKYRWKARDQDESGDIVSWQVAA